MCSQYVGLADAAISAPERHLARSDPNPIGPGRLIFLTFWPEVITMGIGIRRVRARRSAEANRCRRGDVYLSNCRESIGCILSTNRKVYVLITEDLISKERPMDSKKPNRRGFLKG